ncbi:MAG: DNA gyrase subunit A [Clostridia bacterium]|nr:DNA gyrase subunit A [Clostridia bacterium]
MDDEIRNGQPEENGVSVNTGKIVDVDINKEMRTSFLNYSMAVIISRALPDVRDGLKPVHRRILYTMYENNLTPDKAYRKCADTVGSVLGRYHPHGDASVYDALVRLAQTFSLRYILVDGHGNFGSIDGDPAAAYRYTEARMSKLSVEMLTDIEKETVDYMGNYDDRLKEPTVLPARFPNLLVNGSTGIAVGMATNIPPHNLREVIDGMCCLIDNPDATLEDLMQHIKGPDFPTAGIIMGKAGIRAAYATGRGKIAVRARTEIVEGKNGRYQIVVTELPYQVNKARLIESIAELVKDKRIEGISDVNDYSSRLGMRMVIDLKRDANPQVVLNMLFKLTQLQISYGIINLALVNNEPKELTLKQMLQHYIDHQCEIIVRRTQYDLRKAQERAHILEALLRALDCIDEVIALLRASKSIQEGKEGLMTQFGFDEVQATHIVQMRLGQLTGLERQKLVDEMATLQEKIKYFMEILASHDLVLSIVKEEAMVIRDKFGDDRRTEIVNVSGEVDIEDLIADEAVVMTLTRRGYIKRQPVDTYRQQKRGGRGIAGMTRREEDMVETMFTCRTHDHIMFFTNLGRVYRLKCFEVPESSRTGKGMNVVNILPIQADEWVSAMICVRPEDEEKYLCMVTRKGIIKRTALSDFRNVRKTGIIAINLDEGDNLAWVKLTSGEDDLLVATRMGKSIRFNETDARVIGRAARGVKAITMKNEDDWVVGMEILEGEGKVLTVSETGYGRRSDFDDYHIQSRGGQGSNNYQIEKYGHVAAIRVVQDEEDIILISSDGIIIRISATDIRECARPSKGVRVMKVNENERIVTITSTEKAEDEETDAPVETDMEETEATAPETAEETDTTAQEE